MRLSHVGPDPRVSLRESIPGEAERDEIGRRLDRLDAVSRHGPWRKLKELGLTESLKTGYRLSPRGKTVIDDRP